MNIETERKKTHAMKPAVEPQDWPYHFTEHLHSGDIDGATELYEPDARVVSTTGEIRVGHGQIRRVLAGLIEMKTHMQYRLVKAVVTGDIAVLYTDFHVTTRETSGKTIEIKQKAIEVLRRRPEGTWRLIVGDPNGRGY